MPQSSIFLYGDGHPTRIDPASDRKYTRACVYTVPAHIPISTGKGDIRGFYKKTMKVWIWIWLTMIFDFDILKSPHHYKPLTNDLPVTYKWHWGHMLIDHYLNGEHGSVFKQWIWTSSHPFLKIMWRAMGGHRKSSYL